MQNNVFLTVGDIFKESFLINEFLDSKEEKTYIRNVERLVRTSPEYKTWLKYIRMELGCYFLSFKTGFMDGECQIHVHHHPLTLYDLVRVAILESEYFNTFSLSYKVMEYHFKNLVGYVPLDSTAHDQYHNKVYEIPKEIIMGDYYCLKDSLDKSESKSLVIESIDLKTRLSLTEVPKEWYIEDHLDKIKKEC